MVATQLAQNPVVAALLRENLLPRKIGGLEEDEEVSAEQRAVAKRTEQIMANFTPVPNMAERIKKLDDFVHQRAAVKPRMTQPNAIAKLVKTFTPQPGFYQKTTPRTEKVRKQMQEELSLTFLHGSRTPPPTPVLTSQAPTPAPKKYPVNRPQPVKGKLPVTVPKIAGIDFLGVPEVKSQKSQLPRRALLPRRIQQLKQSGMSQIQLKANCFSGGNNLKTNLFNKARQYSQEDLARTIGEAPSAKNIDECHTAPAVQVEEVVEQDKWCWFGRQIADYCGTASDSSELHSRFNKWYRGRLQAWTALHELQAQISGKRQGLEKHLATLTALESAIAHPVETDLPDFDYQHWAQIAAAARHELATIRKLHEVDARVWLTTITRVIQKVGSQLGRMSSVLTKIKESKIPERQHVSIIASLVNDEQINEPIASLDISQIVAAEMWASGKGPDANNSITARLWSKFLHSRNATATLVKGCNFNHFSVQRAENSK